MKKKGQSKASRVRSAALVKVKYLLSTGNIDSGFRIIFEGVLSDLDVKQEEVDRYIEENEEELKQTCLE